MKKILLIVGILVVGWCVERLVTLDSRVKDDLEQTMTQLTGVPVSIQDLDISFLAGEGSVTGFAVANPPGYSKTPAFQMDAISFDLNALSAITKPLVINNLIIEGPVVNLEAKKGGKSNIQDIAGVSITSPKPEKSEEADTEEQTKEEEDSTEQKEEESNEAEEPFEDNYYPIAVKNLEIRNIKLMASKDDEKWEDTVDLIQLQNLGGEEGFSTRELGFIVMKRITTKVIAQAVQRSISDKVEETVKELGNSLLESLINQ